MKEVRIHYLRLDSDKEKHCSPETNNKWEKKLYTITDQSQER